MRTHLVDQNRKTSGFYSADRIESGFFLMQVFESMQRWPLSDFVLKK